MLAIRLVLTASMVVLAVFGGIFIWNQIFRDPWTRDAHVRADVVEIAPRISGEISDVAVVRNTLVKPGDILFTIDRTDYEHALAEAQANLKSARAQAALKAQQLDRDRTLARQDSPAISAVALQDAQLDLNAANAVVEGAGVAVSVARTNLERTVIRAPVGGWVTNLNLSKGDFASTGQPALAIVNSSSFRVDAFFLETMLPRIRVGDAARIRLMSGGEMLQGRVAGISTGISFSQDASANLLQNPTPSFQWIRLAQRIPVEIEIEGMPDGTPLFNGATASVIVETPAGALAGTPWQRIVAAFR